MGQWLKRVGGIKRAVDGMQWFMDEEAGKETEKKIKQKLIDDIKWGQAEEWSIDLTKSINIRNTR